MNAARGFLVVGPLFLIVGVLFGMVMGATGDHTMAPLHAHVNLLGFVLSMVFGLCYHTFPAAGATTLARAHFWLHLVGGVILLVMLYLMFSGRITEAAMMPLAPLAEVMVFLGVLSFAWNMYQHAR